MKKDLDIWGTRNKGEWDKSGHHPFTIEKKIRTDRYFPETITLESDEEVHISKEWGATRTSEEKWNRFKQKVKKLGYIISEEIPSNKGLKKPAVTSLEVSLLQDFYQIILYGPPGTGKTFRAQTKILPELLGVEEGKLDSLQGDMWDIVQFHPSYNYEDFVRGIKVETPDNNVVYETVNRVFGDMCKRAAEDKDSKYALIIDEINRANVSAVLGELIYALEPSYRGKKVNTPYTAEGSPLLVIPDNLYIIGTMNTADRTIGQIDYAVRRRFAFVHCPPDKKVVHESAHDIFADVQSIFDKHVSPDYDAADVRIGHSYFMAEGGKLARKIKYQVIPILREYVKDGVLDRNAVRDIDAIEQKSFGDAKKKDELNEDESAEENSKGKLFYYWDKDGRFGINGIRRTVLSITQDYVNQNPDKSLEEVQAWFPDRGKDAVARGIKLASDISEEDLKNRFFSKEDEQLNIGGQIAYVTTQWGNKQTAGFFKDFIEGVRESGYTVRSCYIVKTHEVRGLRTWDSYREFGFVSASGAMKDGASYTKKLKKIKAGDIVFAFLLEDSDKNKGFIGMGKVIKEAVPITEFNVEGTDIPILDYRFDDGQFYQDKYPVAAAEAFDEIEREWMVRVEWIRTLDREGLEGIANRGHSTFSVISKDNLKIIKRKFEKAE